MNLTLKNVKIHPDMSQETDCFSATLYCDGKQVGFVQNQGTGGCHMYHWKDYQVGRKIEDWAKTQPFKFDFEHLDQIVNRLLKKYEEQRQLKRWCKKGTYFQLKGDPSDTWRSVKVPFSPEVKKFLVDKYDKKITRIANEEIDDESN
jgi:hypothetical protein